MLKMILFIKFLCTFGHNTYTNIIPFEMDREIDLVTFSTKIYLEECKNCRTAMIFYTNEDTRCDQFFQSIAREAKPMAFEVIQIKNFSLELVNDFSINDERADLTIFFLGERSDVASIVYTIELFEMWNIRSNTLVVLSGASSENYKTWLKESFDAMWEKQVLRLLITFYLDEVFKVFTYNPFLDQYAIDITHKNISSFLHRKLRNMNKHPIKFYSLDHIKVPLFIYSVRDGKAFYQGFDGKFIGTFIESMNASFEIHKLSDDFPASLVEGNSQKRLRLINIWNTLRSTYDFDILINAFRIEQICTDHIFLNERNDFQIILPRGGKIPQYINLLELVLAIWLPVTMCFILVTASMGISKKIHFLKPSWTVVLFDNLSVLLTSSIPDRKRLSQENFILMLWMCFCIIFNAWFTSILTSTLVIPKFYPDVNTLEELYRTDLKIYAPPNTGSSVEYIVNDTRLKRHLIYIPENLSAFGQDLLWIKDYRQHGLLLQTRQLSSLKEQEVYSGRPPYHVMSESPVPIAHAYNVVRNKFYYRELQEIIGKILEAGLPIYWKRYNYDMPFEKHLLGTPPDENDVADEPPGWKHLQIAIILLGVLQAVATIVFLCEMIFFCVVNIIHENIEDAKTLKI